MTKTLFLFFCAKLVSLFVLLFYFPYSFDWLDYVIWLNEAHFGHDDPYCIDDFEKELCIIE